MVEAKNKGSKQGNKKRAATGGSREISVAKAITAYLSDAAILLSPKLETIEYNAAFVMFSGQKRRTLDKRFAEGNDVFSLLGPKQSEHRSQAQRCFRDGRVIRLDEVALKNIAGENYVVIMTLIPVAGSKGKIAAVILSLRDVSAEARMQARYKELMALERARADELERQVAERTKELAAALEEVTRLSRTDPLTGLLNRRAFSEYARDALMTAERYERSLGIIMCDLDHFKKTNDTFGHDVGDTVLATTARCLKQSVRGSDKVARFGGEEFIVLLSETDLDTALHVAKRCHANVRTFPFYETIPDLNDAVTISLGVAVFPKHGYTLQEIISNADKALYEAKRQGRDRVCVFSKELKGESVSLEAPMERPRVLLVDIDRKRAQDHVHLLSSVFDVVVAADMETASTLCHDERFEAIVAHELETEGTTVDFLMRSVRDQPSAVRVLVITGRDQYVTLRARSFAAIDCFLLKNDVKEFLVRAIQDGMNRRDVSERRFLRTPSGADTWSEESGRALSRVLAGDTLRMVYQPILWAHDLTPCACEALSRSEEPEFKNPRVMFDVAVRSGRIWHLSRLVRRTVSEDILSFPKDLLVFVNLDPMDIDDPEFLEGEEFLKDIKHRLVFEITERVSIPDLARVKENIAKLKANGYRFAVDDLGSGYAGLNSVALLEPDFIKISPFLIKGIAVDNNRGRLLQRVVDFANDAGVKVIAEGIESDREQNVARDIGCHMLQGFHLGMPDRKLMRQ